MKNLDFIEEKYQTVEQALMDPDVMQDPARAAKLMRELKSLTPLVEAHRALKKAEAEKAEALELLEAGKQDAELYQMAQEQLAQSGADITRLEKELTILLLPQDPNDDKSVIMEIRGGAGGEESALFAGVLFRMYSMYAQTKGFRIEVINRNDTELGGIKEISFTVEGAGAYSKLKFESGVHRVQRVPETENQGRIHTSTATVAVLPEVEDVELEINPGDLQIDTYRSGGAGGQHINKTDSAVRITHLPTGTVVECQDERSQHKNKDKAMRVLRSRLYEKMQAEQNAQIASTRKLQVGTGDRSERIRTYNYPQNRLTDHRIGLTIYHLDRIIEGELDELMDALGAFDQAEKLKESGAQ